jgi:hypothetical protein
VCGVANKKKVSFRDANAAPTDADDSDDDMAESSITFTKPVAPQLPPPRSSAPPPLAPPPAGPPPSLQAKAPAKVEQIQDWSWLLGPTNTYKDGDLETAKYSSESVGARRAVARESTAISDKPMTAEERRQQETAIKQKMIEERKKKAKKAGGPVNLVLDVSDDETAVNDD